MIVKETQEKIQSAYRQFLQSNKLKPRYGQKLMIANIVRTLTAITADTEGERDSNNHVCVIEAGTGTGKTVAYLLAAIPVAQALKKKLVISTATVALQEQIIQKDLPEIKSHTDLSFNFILAKGRSRYLCLSKLDRLLMDRDAYNTFNQALYEDEAPLVDQQSVKIYNSMVDAISAGKWNGDRDNWPQEIDNSVWTPITTNHRECTGRRCSNVTTCSFFKAREAIGHYDCIVANHDLVLADLALGGGAILPDPKETIYIFDEGHHLPDKALSHFAYHSRVDGTGKWLDQNHKVLSSMLDDISGVGNVDHYTEQLPSIFLETKKHLDILYPYCQRLFDEQSLLEVDKQWEKSIQRYRFEQGVVDDILAQQADLLYQQFDRLTALIGKVITEIQSSLEDGYCVVPRVDLEAWLSVVGNWQARAEANRQLWRSYCVIHSKNNEASHNIPLARWITFVEFNGSIDFEVCSSPILASHTLVSRLWDQCYGAVVTSATLTALGKFDRFMMRAGTAADHSYNVMPSPLDFSRATLQIPAFAVEANNSILHTQTIIDHLPELLDPSQGSLVLFSSRRQMLDVYTGLPSSWQDEILLQGDHSKQEMLNQHKSLIDNGKGSILFGLASFAEGVDLPGSYCTHVVIAKLPFSVPDDPVEASLAEWVEAKGGNPFMEISVPDASIKLVQSCGRLLRKEADTGKISILDKRLVTKRYGKVLLNALPEYTVKV
ncbi:ATP-dependent DNA helicase DinG [Candidatus Endobugula sertula]|uniref:ATP-dependent DNA helicase DinG n=1 Tax=Candidatus Endobugula sertula TaxID=62101 RepID=A0A1D2QMR1_9GAMM|nr:ATP-dependent DNA helicase DinG [Candidatus Endobugula sertula]